ncbi:hypothetical protein IT575_02305 [bacterium]|nr:hypothetical protein [bacterium]
MGGPVGDTTPYTSYFLLGEDVYNLRGLGSSDPDIYDAVRILMPERAVFMGLFSRGGSFPAERTEIFSGSINSRLVRYNGFDFYSEPYLRGFGYLDAFGSRGDLDMDLDSDDFRLRGFEDLRLLGFIDLFEAQRLIDDVSFIAFRDDSSSFTTTATWELSGYYYGRFFEVSFEQDMRAIADYYLINDY